MDESSPCLLRSFSHASPSSREANEEHIVDAFGNSISFGKFMSETLDWVKFSAFTQNRYLEEAEKCLKPGLVAQKKAHFEEYFKDIAARKALALSEEANIVTAKIYGKPSTDRNIDASVTNSRSSLDAASERDLSAEEYKSERVQEHKACAEIHALVKGSADQGIEDSANRKKRRVPSVKSLMNNSRVSKAPPSPVNRTNSRPPRVPSNAATNSKKATRHSNLSNPIQQQVRSSRERAASCKIHPEASQTSTRASIDRSSKEASNISPTLDKASVSSRTPKASSNTILTSKRETPCGRFKDGSKTPRPLSRASVYGKSGDNSNILQPASVNRISRAKTKDSQKIDMVSKQPSIPAKPKDRRTKTQPDKSVSGATTGAAVRKSNSQSANAGGKKPRSTTKAVPFSLRIDERAAKRKMSLEKMEGKCDGRGTGKGKGQLQTGSKTKTEPTSTKPRQSTNTSLKTNPRVAPRERPNTSLKTNPRVAPHVRPPNNLSKKIASTQPRSPKPGRKPAPSVQDKIALAPAKPSTSSRQAMEKGQQSTFSVTPLQKKKISPNTLK